MMIYNYVPGSMYSLHNRHFIPVDAFSGEHGKDRMLIVDKFFWDKPGCVVAPGRDTKCGIYLTVAGVLPPRERVYRAKPQTFYLERYFYGPAKDLASSTLTAFKRKNQSPERLIERIRAFLTSSGGIIPDEFDPLLEAYVQRLFSRDDELIIWVNSDKLGREKMHKVSL